MIKRGILNADLRSLTARIGHRDRFAIVDAGYNIPLGIETVDLAFLPNIPSMVQVVEGILNEMAIEEIQNKSGVEGIVSIEGCID